MSDMLKRKKGKHTEIWFQCCTWGCEFDLNSSVLPLSNKGCIKRFVAVCFAKVLVWLHKKRHPTHDPYLQIQEVDF